jgi:transcriptional regulator with XRE-family HTH domain
MSATQVVTSAQGVTGRVGGKLRQNGAAIRSLREKDGWHQPEFARKVGMSQAALSNIEREKRSARPATIHRIARALRVPVAAITREYDKIEGPAALFGPHPQCSSSRQYGRLVQCIYRLFPKWRQLE